MTRVERIREAVRITSLLSELGYRVVDDEREQQFGCDLHGTRDGKPSARVYPSSNSWYCFACGKYRDAIKTVMDKMEIDFRAALAWLEKTYNLPTYTPQAKDPTQTLDEALAVTFTPPQDDNADRVIVQIRALLDGQRHDKVLTCQQTMELWERLDVAVAKQAGAGMLTALREDILQQVRDAARVP